MPKRIQMRRSKGWRKPEGAVYVGRPTKWGNPHKLADFTAANAVALYQEQFSAGLLRVKTADLAELRGKDLACWCLLDQPCHADVLLRLANP